MLIKCDLAFRENSILTKEMLGQMNHEPKWLILDAMSGVDCGIISGFEFVNEEIDSHSAITKGNIIIDGCWYRLDEDYILNGDDLESGQQYDIVLIPNNGSYEFDIVISGTQNNGIKLAGFKYEFSEHKRVFRIPEELEDFRRGEAYIKEINLPYYNFNGVCICPKHIANCIKKSLARIRNRSFRQEIIYQTILNTGTVAIESLCDLVGMKREIIVSETTIEELIKMIGGYKIYDSEPEPEEIESEDVDDRPQTPTSPKRSRRMGQRRKNT